MEPSKGTGGEQVLLFKRKSRATEGDEWRSGGRDKRGDDVGSLDPNPTWRCLVYPPPAPLVSLALAFDIFPRSNPTRSCY
jgi:hypothetical protein